MNSIYEVINRLQTYLVPDLNINFINRDHEVEALFRILKLGKEIEPANSLNLVITGPWGCGKTEFARALTNALKFDEDFIVIYMNLPKSPIKEEFFIPTSSEIIESIEELVTSFIGDRAKLLFHVYEIVKNLAKRVKLRNKFLLIFFDEVTVSLAKFSVNVSELIAGLSKEIYSIAWKYYCQVHIILLTSEQAVMKYFKREEGKNFLIYGIWHLSENDFYKLLRSINCPIDKKLVWKVSGGCPRIAYELKIRNWDIENLINDKIKHLKECLASYCKTFKVSINHLIREIERWLHNLDELSFYPSWDFLVSGNIVINLPTKWLDKKPSYSYWIGYNNAFQIPLYYWILKVISEEKSLNISAQDVLSYIRD